MALEKARLEKYWQRNSNPIKVSEEKAITLKQYKTLQKEGAVALSNSCAAPFTCKKITARPRKYPAVGVKLMYDQTH